VTGRDKTQYSQLPTNSKSLNGWTIVALVYPLTLQKKTDR